jgi:Putative homoserine kinase type II (protein kinase fold)
MQLTEIVNAFGLTGSTVKPFGTGLINNTWLVETEDTEGKYILQRVNTNIFKSPQDIATNIRLLSDHLKQYHPEYFFISPVQTREGADHFETNEGSFRMFPYVPNSHTIDVVQNPEQAYEAAKAFGKFTRMFSGLDLSRLKITLPHFHDLDLRFRQFIHAVQHGNKSRLAQSQKLVDFILGQKAIVQQFLDLKADKEFRLRTTHHDTKISNVLFDENDQCICVIDLDTVMPGYFISDVGDMMRTYLSPVSEEEADYSKILARKDFFNAIVEGYSTEMKDELTMREKEQFLYAGKFMIYMQALRFITDHLSDDIYYGARYEGQNFVRAGNQVALLKQLLNW